MATIPTTTPAAMPALLGPPPDFDDPEDAAALAELLAVTTMVCPPTVTTDGLAEVVEEGVVTDELGEADDSAPAFATVPEPVR